MNQWNFGNLFGVATPRYGYARFKQSGHGLSWTMNSPLFSEREGFDRPLIRLPIGRYGFRVSRLAPFLVGHLV